MVYSVLLTHACHACAGGGVTQIVMPYMTQGIAKYVPEFEAWRWAFFLPGFLFIFITCAILILGQVRGLCSGLCSGAVSVLACALSFCWEHCPLLPAHVQDLLLSRNLRTVPLLHSLQLRAACAPRCCVPLDVRARGQPAAARRMHACSAGLQRVLLGDLGDVLSLGCLIRTRRMASTRTWRRAGRS